MKSSSEREPFKVLIKHPLCPSFFIAGRVFICVQNFSVTNFFIGFEHVNSNENFESTKKIFQLA